MRFIFIVMHISASTHQLDTGAIPKSSKLSIKKPPFLKAFSYTFAAMFKRFVALFLLVTLISTHFSMYVVYAGFTMNRKLIAEKFCINKSRPWLHCDGKCYFMKKIRQAEENEKKQESKDHLNRLEISFLQEPFRFAADEAGVISTIKEAYPTYGYHYSSRYLSCIFRPPKQVA